MSDEPKQTFHQFPLALLAYGADYHNKLSAIVAWATINAGMLAEKKMGGKKWAQQRLEGSEGANLITMSRAEHRAWALGKNIVNWSWHDSPHFCVRLYAEAQQFLSSFGKSPFVRVSSDLLIETEKGIFDFRDLAVLLAVYAVIGDKQYAIVHRDRVRAGALGYSSPKTIFDQDGNTTPAGKATLAARPDKAMPLTTNQVRYTLDRLHTRKFFSRLQPKKNGRIVYYSRSLSHDALAEILLKRLEKKATTALAQDGAEQSYREKAAALLKRLTCGELPNKSPDNHQAITAGVTAGVTGTPTAGVTALIDASPNRCLLNECSPNEYSPSGCASNAAAAARIDGNGKVRELDGVVAGLAKKLTPRCGIPRLPEVEAFLMICFAGAVDFAKPFYRAMEKSHWKDKDGKPITDWKALAKAYASTCWRKRAGIGTTA
jgi:hypothetical protein